MFTSRPSGRNNHRSSTVAPQSHFLPLDLAYVRNLYRQASNVIIQEYERRAPDRTDQVTPGQLAEAIEQFLIVATRLDRDAEHADTVGSNDISQIGDYGLQLLGDLSHWASQLDLELPKHKLEDTALATASWIIRHEGQIRTPEIIVDGLARLANSTEDTSDLRVLTLFMSDVINALADVLREDLEKSNPGRAWRILHLNRAIVATRSHQPELMDKVFGELTVALPEDAPGFFTEGIAQMDKLDYPQHVRAIMQRYFDDWGRRVMH